MSNSQAKNSITIHCLKPGCPRKRKILWDKSIPKNTAHIFSDCPWHEYHGAKEYPEYFFDKNWKRINQETGEIIWK